MLGPQMKSRACSIGVLTLGLLGWATCAVAMPRAQRACPENVTELLQSFTGPVELAPTVFANRAKLMRQMKNGVALTEAAIHPAVFSTRYIRGQVQQLGRRGVKVYLVAMNRDDRHHQRKSPEVAVPIFDRLDSDGYTCLDIYVDTSRIDEEINFDIARALTAGYVMFRFGTDFADDLEEVLKADADYPYSLLDRMKAVRRHVDAEDRYDEKMHFLMQFYSMVIGAVTEQALYRSVTRDGANPELRNRRLDMVLQVPDDDLQNMFVTMTAESNGIPQELVRALYKFHPPANWHLPRWPF